MGRAGQSRARRGAQPRRIECRARTFRIRARRATRSRIERNAKTVKLRLSRKLPFHPSPRMNLRCPRTGRGLCRQRSNSRPKGYTGERQTEPVQQGHLAHARRSLLEMTSPVSRIGQREVHGRVTHCTCPRTPSPRSCRSRLASRTSPAIPDAQSRSNRP